MTDEYVTYNKPRLTVNKSIELQQRILNPHVHEHEHGRLISRSAVKAVEKRLTVAQALELQQKIVVDSY